MSEKLYMIMASFKDCVRNNFEITDYNLTLDEAKKIKQNWAEMINDNTIDEDWKLDDDPEYAIRIVEQGQKI